MLETKRLILKPLNYEQLIKYSNCDNSLEEELNLFKNERTISNELKEALEQVILPSVLNEKNNYLFSTIWTAISKEENKIVGDICMYGEPNLDGEIEIGYGTYVQFQNKGYMTEIVNGIINWAKNEKSVKSIIASTETNNIASYKVLQKNHFIKIGEDEKIFKWKLEIN